MSIRTLVVSSIVFVAFASIASAQETASKCGPLTRWALPRQLVVEATPDDARTFDLRVTQARINVLIAAAERYCRSRGRYPESLDSLFASVEVAEESRQCGLGAHALRDAWNQPIYFSVANGQLVVRSAGADGRFSTADDLVVPTSGATHTEEFELDASCRKRTPLVPA